MDKERELAGKVDALLKRHASETGGDDRNIPVLSEIVHAPEWKPSPGYVPIPATLTADEQRALAHQVFERVFAKINSELAAQIENRLIESIAAHVGPVLDHVITDMRQGIADAIGDAIKDALNEALSRRNRK